MRKLLFSICCALLSSAAFGQAGSSYSYSFDIRYYNLMQLPKLLNQTNSQNYQSKYFQSGFIKFNDNQLSYRIGGYFNRNDVRFPNQCTTCQEGSGTLSDYYFKLGFEKNFNYSVVQPYIGMDIGYRSYAFSGVVNNIQPGSTSPDYDVESNKNGLLISPLIGLKINVLKQVTLFAEGNLDFYYSYERRETTDMTAGSPTSFFRFTRMEYLLNPVSLGIQIHFGSKD